MHTHPFDTPGRFYRGNLHTHSTESDGALGAAEVCRRYRERGYDFLCLSDHFLPAYDFPVTDTRPFRTAGFTTILGAEVHVPSTALGEKWHLLANGLPPDFEPTRPGESAPELAARCAAAGAFVSLVHPEWYALACDDAHFKVDDAFGAWVMVHAEAREPEALTAALKAGRYYSSTGPEIHAIRFEGDEVEVECSPAVGVYLLGKGSRATQVLGHELTRVRLQAAKLGKESFRRVAVVDALGRRAWSNPFWPEAA